MNAPERHDCAMSEPMTTRSTGPDASKRTTERRPYWIAAIVLFGAIAVLTTIAVLTASPGPRKDTQSQLEEQGGAKPHIIPRPGEGQAPEHPNDRGGWEQFLVLGLIVCSVAAIGALAWRSSRRALAKAAAAPPSGPGIAPRRPAPPKTTSG